jgi:hypothetical protein
MGSGSEEVATRRVLEKEKSCNDRMQIRENSEAVG